MIQLLVDLMRLTMALLRSSLAHRDSRSQLGIIIAITTISDLGGALIRMEHRAHY